jgi:6-phosphogluconate dehydrogenase
MIGLGKMGGNMARRLRGAGIEVVGFNRDAAPTEALARECGLLPAESTEALVAMLDAPRLVWLMLPAGDVTEDYVQQLSERLQPGDILIDGANSYYKDSMRRGQQLANAGILFVDAGVSGGVWGLENGYALMVGGTQEAFVKVQPFVADSGEGRWAALEAIEQGVPTPVMSLALMARFASQGQQDYSSKLLAVMRNQFGGHAIRSSNERQQ